jgi:hypothetical protein
MGGYMKLSNGFFGFIGTSGVINGAVKKISLLVYVTRSKATGKLYRILFTHNARRLSHRLYNDVREYVVYT